MQRTSWVFLLVMTGICAACGKSTQPEVSQEPPAGQDVNLAAGIEGQAAAEPSIDLPPVDATPEEIVVAFLQASRNGDEQVATLLLTNKARQETEREGLALDPPGTPTMKFEVGAVEFADNQQNAAYVNSTWSETETGEAEKFEVVWVLRKQADGWRIAGMATQTSPEQQSEFLNFEDPRDILRIKQQIGEEGTTPAVVDPLTAQQPGEATRR